MFELLHNRKMCRHVDIAYTALVCIL